MIRQTGLITSHRQTCVTHFVFQLPVLKETKDRGEYQEIKINYKINPPSSIT